MRKRLILLFFVLFGVTVLAFSLSQLSEVNPAEAYIRRTVVNATPEMLAEASKSMGYDRPIYEQYGRWLVGCLHGDFGMSLLTRTPVGAEIAKRLPVTLSVVGLALLWTVLFTAPISVLCVRMKNKWVDQFVRGITIIGVSIPGFWLAFLFLLLFASHLSWFKVVDPGSLRGLILPSITVSIPVTASMIRLLRTGILEELSQDYVFYARARGLSFQRILWLHALPNALPPMITLLAQYLGGMIAGSAVVESIFSLRGIGSYLLDAILAYDTPAINGCVVIVAVIFVLCTLVAEGINTKLSPSIVAEGGEHG